MRRVVRPSWLSSSADAAFRSGAVLRLMSSKRLAEMVDRRPRRLKSLKRRQRNERRKRERNCRPQKNQEAQRTSRRGLEGCLRGLCNRDDGPVYRPVADERERKDQKIDRGL